MNLTNNDIHKRSKQIPRRSDVNN